MPTDLTATIHVAGHRDMVGSAIVRRLQALGYRNIVTAAHAELDLTDQTTEKVTGFTSEFAWDNTKPDGAPHKLMDVPRMTALGWRFSIKLEAGLRHAYRSFETSGSQQSHTPHPTAGIACGSGAETSQSIITKHQRK